MGRSDLSHASHRRGRSDARSGSTWRDLVYPAAAVAAVLGATAALRPLMDNLSTAADVSILRSVEANIDLVDFEQPDQDAMRASAVKLGPAGFQQWTHYCYCEFSVGDA